MSFVANGVKFVHIIEVERGSLTSCATSYLSMLLHNLMNCANTHTV